MNKAVLMYFAAITTSVFLFYNCSTSKSVSQSDRGNKSAISFYYTAETEIKKGDFQSALSNLDSAIAYNPGFANFYQLKGWVLEQLQQPDSAIVAYENYARYRSSNPEVLSRLGGLYMGTGNYEKAGFYLKRLVQQHPDSVNAHIKLAEVYYHLSKYRLALDYLNQYRKSSASIALQYWKWLGLNYYQSRRYPEAISALEKYIVIEPNDARAFKYLGLARFGNGDYDQAITYLNRAESIGGYDPEVYIYRARYFMVFNRPETALEQLRIALSRDSSNTDLLFETGVIHYRQKDYSAGEEYFLKVKARQPEYWPVYRYLGFLEEQRGNLLLAQDYYKLYLDHTLEFDEEVVRHLKTVRAKIGNR